MILTVTFSLDNIDLINKNQTGNHNVVFSYINDIRKKKTNTLTVCQVTMKQISQILVTK